MNDGYWLANANLFPSQNVILETIMIYLVDVKYSFDLCCNIA